ncbi:MAG: hypothetical protein A2297_09565 [Elusimicrobia bacterium RIFOXYB2_FULL_48_7]|nr:MAG: hypothetical protein A2297_09565 [Elusimicrobia bacterium RIFOXYB2_FULL_48_7]
MDYKEILKNIEGICGAGSLKAVANGADEVYVEAPAGSFNKLCHAFHKTLNSPVMMFFAVDNTAGNASYRLYCVFSGAQACGKWFFVYFDVPENKPEFNSIAKEIFSASLFEREMKEMFGIIPLGNPDTRRLHLHPEVWPKGNYPLRKSFKAGSLKAGEKKEYVFGKIEGDGIFEVPVGPVHAGIIGPGHFRFSAAGEPIINLEIRLGFTHRGVEKLFEGKKPEECLALSECASGDSVFAHSLAFCGAVEKINSIDVPPGAQYQRCIFLELERMYNHVADMGGIAIDVGFSFPSAYASTMKESLLCLNEKLTGSRYLKGINAIGGTGKSPDKNFLADLSAGLDDITQDFNSLKEMLLSNVSFMDRADNTGILRKKTAEDLGVIGMPARASGIPNDLRKDFPGVYAKMNFKAAKQNKGDVLARLNVRFQEFEESISIIRQAMNLLHGDGVPGNNTGAGKPGFALGYCEGWRGPVLYWLKINEKGFIDRCKIVDPSFHNWQGLSYAVLGEIIPDFPLCNKSFDLSYSGNDL